MQKLIFQMLISLDGYYEGLNHEIDWHVVEDEFNDYAHNLIQSAGIILFGRVTYQMMASFWPSAVALRTDPVTAKLMNETPKIVFSKTLKNVDWKNTTLINTDPVKEISRLKKLPGKDLVMLASSDLAVSLLKEGVIDEFQVNINPIILSSGKTLFKGLDQRVPLKLIKTQVFKSGVIVLTYQPD
jgi:dihydrofolate reductase